MNVKKCNYIIFSNVGNTNKKKQKIKFNLKLYNEQIQYNSNPIFLGIILDEHLCFSKHFDSLRQRSLKRLNIIKIFSHKSWHLGPTTLCNIYKSLIGSIFNYSFFTLANISEESEKILQRIQNRAIRCIFKLNWNSLNSDIIRISKILSVGTRFVQLGCRFLTKSLNNNTNISKLTYEFLWSRSKFTSSQSSFQLLVFYGLQVSHYF